MSQPTLEFSYACRASVGARQHQEDSSQVWRPGSDSSGFISGQPILAVLADGMGGHVSGEIASTMACDRYIAVFSTEDGAIGPRMERSLHASNDALNGAIRENSALKGMGCTIVAGFINEEGLRWVSVGDSALLLFRDGALRRLNADHSLGAMLDKQAEAGIITPEIAKGDRRRRALRSALTGDAIPMKDVEPKAYPLQPKDWVVLATDGLLTLSGDEIASIIGDHEGSTPDRLADALMAAVEGKREPHQDNTTIIVAHVGTQAAQKVKAPHPKTAAPALGSSGTNTAEPVVPAAPAAKRSQMARMIAIAIAVLVLLGIASFLYSGGDEASVDVSPEPAATGTKSGHNDPGHPPAENRASDPAPGENQTKTAGSNEQAPAEPAAQKKRSSREKDNPSKAGINSIKALLPNRKGDETIETVPEPQPARASAPAQ